MTTVCVVCGLNGVGHDEQQLALAPPAATSSEPEGAQASGEYVGVHWAVAVSRVAAAKVAGIAEGRRLELAACENIARAHEAVWGKTGHVSIADKIRSRGTGQRAAQDEPAPAAKENKS